MTVGGPQEGLKVGGRVPTWMSQIEINFFYSLDTVCLSPTGTVVSMPSKCQQLIAYVYKCMISAIVATLTDLPKHFISCCSPEQIHINKNNLLAHIRL